MSDFWAGIVLLCILVFAVGFYLGGIWGVKPDDLDALEDR